jgi:hypothetical protein
MLSFGHSERGRPAQPRLLGEKMNQDVIRQILWNIPIGFILFLYLMLIRLTGAFIFVAVRWYRMVWLGTSEARPRNSRRRRLHRRRVPEAAGFSGFPYYLVAMMEVLR